MDKFLIYSTSLKNKYEFLPYIDNIEEFQKSKTKFIYVACDEKNINNLLSDKNIKNRVVIIFDFLNSNKKAYLYYKQGVRKFLPYLYVYSLNKQKHFYTYKKIFKKEILLPIDSEIKIEDSYLKIEKYWEKPIKIEVKKLSRKKIKEIYSILYLNEIDNIYNNNEKTQRFIMYFRDISLKNKATKDIIGKELGPKYASYFSYFDNIKQKYLNMYKDFNKLQFKFKKLFSIHPDPMAMFDKNNKIEESNDSFKKLFGNIESIEEISKYEQPLKELKLNVFKNFDCQKIKTGIVKVFSDKYYVLKFEIMNVENDKYVIYFFDITENTVFEIVSILKLTFEEGQTLKENFEEFSQYIIWTLKNLFNMNSCIKLKDIYKKGEEIIYGNCSTDNMYILKNDYVEIGLEFTEEFHEYDKKEVAKSLLKACESKIASDKINSYNKKIQEDLNIAKFVQTSIVENTEKIDEPQYFLYYNASSNIGGDFACVGKAKDSFIFSVGDISGHGIASSLMSIFINTIVKETIQINKFEDIKSAIEYIKERLIKVQLPEYMFSAIIYGKLNIKTGKLSYASGGFQFPILVKRNRTIVEFPTGGGILSSAFNFEQEYYDFTLNKEDLVLIFTDGMIELQNNTNEVMDFVKNKLLEIQSTDPEIISNCLLDEIKKEYNINNFDDDITLLAFKIQNNNKDYALLSYKNRIYSNLKTLSQKNSKRYFEELLEKVKNSYPQKKVSQIEKVIKMFELLFQNEKDAKENIFEKSQNQIELKILPVNEENILINIKSTENIIELIKKNIEKINDLGNIIKNTSNNIEIIV